MTGTDIEATVQAFLRTFEARELSQCLAVFADDATIYFGQGCYRGKEAIEEWHRARFAANLKISHYGKIIVEGEKASFELVVCSDNLRGWNIGDLQARATFVFEDCKIKEAKFNIAARSLFDSFFENW